MATAETGHLIIEADARTPLNAQVWEHEAKAKAQQLELVVELYHKRHRVSKAIAKLLKKDRELARDTLRGIYLLRIDVAKAGPEAAVKLTPYAIFGIPLFVAWNPLGQVLAATALTSTKQEQLVSALSAFFEDVAEKRRHELNPAPPLPVQDNLARLRARSKTEPPKQPQAGRAEPAPMPEAESKPPAKSDPIQQLEEDLDHVLASGVHLAQTFLSEHDLRSDFSLHSLRQLDAHLDENADDCRTPEFARKYLGALGIYLGCVVCTQADATWFVDDAQKSPVEALALHVTGPDGDHVYRPVAIALERLGDASKGFYGHAVTMCRLL